MSDGVMERMMRAIVPCRMTLTDVDGTWKMSQNKPDAVRHQAADHVEAYGQGTDLAVLAALMRAVDGQ
jgi:transcriptional regulator